CSSITPTDSPDRRIIFAAIVNCNAVTAANGWNGTIPVESYASFFVTRPMENGGGQGCNDTDTSTACDTAMKGELVDLTTLHGDTVTSVVARDDSQLYR